MNNFNQSPDQVISSKWQQYIKLLRSDSKIKSAAQPHYGQWVSAWQKDGGQASQAVTTKFFENLGRRRDLKDWHYIQAVSAVQLWAEKNSCFVMELD